MKKAVANFFNRLLKQMNIENVDLRCKDLLDNPCREFVARRMYFAVSDKLKVELL